MRKSLIALIVFFSLLVLCLIAYQTWLSLNPSEGTIVVTDALNRTVKIKAPVSRVIITGTGSWPIITAAYMFPEAKNVLYGLSESLNVSLFRMIDPNITAKMVSNLAVAQPNVDEIVKAKPDVVILKSTMKKLGDTIEEVGIPVVYVDFENLESYIRDIKVLGKIFMDEGRGEKIARYYNETCNFVMSRIPANIKRERVLFLYYSTKGGTITFNVPGSGWLQTFMIEMAGGNPLSKELLGTGWNTVGFERIVQWNPDIIFLVTYSSSPTSSSVKRQLLEDDMWRGISAIQSGRVYAVPDDCSVGALGSWDCPGSRWILGLMWMAKKINPAFFSDLNIMEEAKKFYIEMYGLRPSDADTIISQITGDL